MPLSFHTRVTRIETASPLSNSCSDMSVIQLCSGHTSAHRYSLCVSGTLSLAWHSRKISQQDLSSVSSEVMSQVVWNPASLRTVRHSLTDVNVLRHVR